ncbi:ATP-binding protein [Acetobacteraceae bacterium KSS8]|uniref:histidine kinase n=1 Tax=Endosaccharibacter trunci TaxID=2812733 RepID=A0ABT1W8F0_9PROT|nr:ATP-binding protein [Acetobacteraceae bacterium KSS8]
MRVLPVPPRKLWPGGLVSRVILVLLVAVMLEFLGSTMFYEQAENYSAEDLRLTRAAGQLSADLRLMDATLPDQRARIAALLSDNDLVLAWDPSTTPQPEPQRLHSLHRALAAHLGPNVGLHLGGTGPGAGMAGGLTGTIMLKDGSQLRFKAPSLLQPHPFTRGLRSAAILAGCVLLAAVMLVRTMSMPLRALAQVADAIGRGPAVKIPEDGPGEVRRLSRAMIAMQDRIHRLITDRTEALAAVSHDLRTPLGRLRLRAGFLDDAELQHAIEEDLDEMEAMVGSVLSYLAGEADSEAKRTVDLAAMLATLVDDAADAGRDAVYRGPDHLPVRIRPLAMKRVFANLLSNALDYAGNVRVLLLREGDRIRVRFEDDGPGIPAADLERVTTPFYRVESSRSRATGGLGLGLAIVLREIGREQGSVTLQNRHPQGLLVEILLENAC